MTNEEAILRLAQDTDDDSALLAIAENNLGILRAAIKRCFCGRAGHNRLLNTLLLRISWRTKYFIRGHDYGDEWIASCAETECERLRNELGSLGSGPSRKTRHETGHARARYVCASYANQRRVDTHNWELSEQKPAGSL
jgi:hypothetical protein